MPPALTRTGNREIQLRDVLEGNEPMEAFLAQLTPEELATIVRGEGMCSPRVTPGVASCFGGLSKSLHDDYGIPVAAAADGPSGIRMDVGGHRLPRYPSEPCWPVLSIHLLWKSFMSWKEKNFFAMR